MKNKNLVVKIIFTALILLLLLSFIAPAIFSQNLPRQEKLLNGLKVLMWSDPKSDMVSLKVRVHSGSAFDPQGKEGVMKLLAANIFPNSETADFFKEDLGGGLQVTSNYDYIEIDASAKTDKFLPMLETIANAVSNPTIDKETTTKLKASLLAQIDELEKQPAYVADRSAAKRLLGTFPYGRSEYGTAESVKKIDFADLIDARQRFLTADNATIAISGKFDPNLAFRAARRYFGAWLKSDKRVPSTFRQPDDPDTSPFGVTIAGIGRSEVRFALRGIARSDKDYAASEALSKVLQSRMQNLTQKELGANFTVTNGAYILPGLLILGYGSAKDTVSAMPLTVGSSTGQPPTAPTQNIASSLLSQPVTDAEFAKAKADVVAEMSRREPSDWWLDVDTYRITSAQDDIEAFKNFTIVDVQRLAQRLAKNPVVTVSVTSSD